MMKIRFTGRMGHGLLAYLALGLAFGLSACDSTTSSDPQVVFTSDTVWNRTVYVGATYTFPATLAGPAPCNLRAYQGDSLIDEWPSGVPGLVPVSMQPQSNDTIRLTATCGTRADTVIHVVHRAVASGFAPIESSQVRTFDRTSESACWVQYGGTRDSVRITYTPLGATGEGFRFQRHRVGIASVIRGGKPDSTYPVESRDTIDLKIQSDTVKIRSGTEWVLPDPELPFRRDVLTEGLVPNAGWDVPLEGTISGGSNGSVWSAKYRSGLGLREYSWDGIPSVCGRAQVRLQAR